MKNPLTSLRYYKRYLGSVDTLKLFGARLFNYSALDIATEYGPVSIRPFGTDALMAFDVLWAKEYSFPVGHKVSCIVDAGANIGCASIYFSASYPGASIFAIEPDGENFKMLTLNTSRLQQVACERAALYPHHARLYLDHSLDAACAVRTIADATGSCTSSLVVPTVTMPELIERIGFVDILKVDIEGAEAALFDPLNDLSWLSSVNSIVIELHDRYTPNCSRNFWGAVSHLFPYEQVKGENICVSKYPFSLSSKLTGH